MLATLRDTLASLAASYPTRAADDELLLPHAHVHRTAQARVQQLLHNAATLIDALEVPPAPPVCAHRLGAMLHRG